MYSFTTLIAGHLEMAAGTLLITEDILDYHAQQFAHSCQQLTVAMQYSLKTKRLHKLLTVVQYSEASEYYIANCKCWSNVNDVFTAVQ